MLLVHSLSSDTNQVLFSLRERETVLKREKVYKRLVQDCLRISFLFFTSLKMHGNSKNDQFSEEKSETTALLEWEQHLVPNLNLTLN